jgi:hypothetical protein
MTPVDTITVENLTVKIYPDYDGDHECPIDKNLKDDGIWFVTFQRRSTLSEFHDFLDPSTVEHWAKKNKWDAFPLFYYEHGNCIYKVTEGGNPFSCPWDSGQVGWILVKRSDFKRKNRLEIAQSWANAVTTWCNGDYYGYVIENEDGDNLESCWGFDDADYCKEEATDLAKHLAADLAEKVKEEQKEAYDDMYGQLG